MRFTTRYVHSVQCSCNLGPAFERKCKLSPSLWNRWSGMALLFCVGAVAQENMKLLT